MALPKRYETVARLGCTSTTGDPEGEIAPGRRPSSRSSCRPAASPSGRRPTPRSRSTASAPTRCARAGEAVEVPEREVDVTRFEQLWRERRARGVRDRVLVGHLRALAGRRPRRRLLRRAAAHPRSARFDVADADAERLIALDDALAFLPALDLEGDARPRRPTASPSPATPKGLIRLRDEDGLIALAEPRGGATLKPVVGFRG